VSKGEPERQGQGYTCFQELLRIRDEVLEGRYTTAQVVEMWTPQSLLRSLVDTGPGDENCCVLQVQEGIQGERGVSAQEYVEMRGWYQGTSNITSFSVVYSIKKRKFVKGYFSGDRVSGDILYKLFPGRYIRFFL